MQLSITTTHQPATDLGYLLHKHPDKVQEFSITGGKAHVFYPEATAERCTATLLVELDSIDLVRTLKVPGDSLMLKHYVNDRPFVASSFTSSALTKVYRSAMNGNCKDKPELVNQALPLEVSISVLSVKGGKQLIDELFEPLGYEIEVTNYPLDEKFTDWGDSSYYTVVLRQTIPLKDFLTHLYVLLPVFDKERHSWVSQNDVENLLAKGGEWLKNHPKKSVITNRYLKRIKRFTREAFERLVTEEVESEGQENQPEEPKANKEKRLSMHQQRLNAALQKLLESEAKSVLDLGCGEGKLLRKLMKERQFEKIVGMDVSYRSLQIAREKLYLDEVGPRKRDRIQLIQGSLTYRDERLTGFEAAALIEVIEHLDMERLAALERVVFEFAQPHTIIVTTPNAEYNEKYEFLDANSFRHDDHRFEWTRAEFKEWATKMNQSFGYAFEIFPVGEVDEKVGASSQMAVFKKIDR
ncbi:MAG: 3' terminal RNA ribose 2'-O-methyltransferase Hen1 [Flammeovirgaceae bacterium]